MTEPVFDRAFVAARAVLDGAERPCAVAVRDGRIAAVLTDGAAESVAAHDIVRLADGEVLLPGLVDTHVHINEPGRTEWEGFDTGTRAAAAGGVTTVIDMPLNSIPSTTTADALAVKRERASAQAHVDVGFWGGAVPGNVGELEGLHAAGVFGFKCFLVDSGVPEFPPLDPAGLAAAMAETARLGALLIVHAEDAEQIAAAPAPGGPSYTTYLQSRPPAAEERAIERVLAEARELGPAGPRVHVLHLSSAGALAQLRAARADGVDVSVETCPHYLAIVAEEIDDGATQFKCAPPIRDAGNRERLWEALAGGEIDMIVSDHSPCTADLKRRETGDFAAAWGGIASLELGLPVVWTAARTRGHGLADVVRWMASAPADRVGLTYKGRIAVGADADLVVFDPEAEFVVDPSQLQQRNPVSAYAGRRLAGVVRQTWLRGERVEESSAAGHGRLIERGRRE
jgi:allantoinase